MISRGRNDRGAARPRAVRRCRTGIARYRCAMSHTHLSPQASTSWRGPFSACHYHTPEVSVRLIERFCKSHVTRKAVIKMLQCSELAPAAAAIPAAAAGSAVATTKEATGRWNSACLLSTVPVSACCAETKRNRPEHHQSHQNCADAKKHDLERHKSVLLCCSRLNSTINLNLTQIDPRVLPLAKARAA